MILEVDHGAGGLHDLPIAEASRRIAFKRYACAIAQPDSVSGSASGERWSNFDVLGCNGLAYVHNLTVGTKDADRDLVVESD